MATRDVDPLFVDGLMVCRWSDAVIDAMRQGGVTAANCTCCVWEGFRATIENICELKLLVARRPDAARVVEDVNDIRDCHADGRFGVILGFQNLSAIEDDERLLSVFRELGVRVAQLCYNTQNFVGSGCYESRDSGLSDFGHDVVAEMNRLGILIDLSHVGPRTSEDAIRESSTPVAYTHVAPAALHAHPRNKTDAQLRSVAEAGGVVGVTFLTWFLAAGERASTSECVDAVEHVLNVVGEDHVAIGSDFTEGHDRRFLEWILRDKGTGRPLVDIPFADISLDMPVGMSSVAELPGLVAAMRRRGWSEGRVRKVCGENWLRLFNEVWGAGVDRSRGRVDGALGLPAGGAG